MRYVPYEELGGRPHVVVDGSPTDGTVLVLSHWPGTPTPAGLERDLSAEMALAYSRRLDLHGDADIVTNNHFDQDGLVSVLALVDPAWSQAHEALLIDVARAGDFGVFRDRRAARASMAIAAYADPARSPLENPTVGALYTELLARLPEMALEPDRYRRLWVEEDRTLAESEDLIRRGAVEIDERADLDLAIVRIPDGAPDAGGHRFGQMWSSGLHPMAVFNATDALAVASLRGRRYEFTYRYESWVQYRSRRPRPRVDLGPLAARLGSHERGDARWVAEEASWLTPRLSLAAADESAIAPDDFVALLVHHLSTAAPAWDPYPLTAANADAE